MNDRKEEYSLRDTLSLLVKMMAIVAVTVAVSMGCANRGAGPQGGPVDSIPPQLIKSEPYNGQLNYTKNTMNLDFDEIVLVEGAYDKVIVSPPQKTAVVVKALQPYLTRRRYDWFFDRFSLISLPLLALFWTGTARRIGEYGLTESRFYLVLCGAVMTLCLLLFLSRRTGRYLAVSLTAFVLFAATAYIPPITAGRLSVRSQMRRADAAARSLGVADAEGRLRLGTPTDADTAQRAQHRILYQSLEYIGRHDPQLLQQRYGVEECDDYLRTLSDRTALYASAYSEPDEEVYLAETFGYALDLDSCHDRIDIDITQPRRRCAPRPGGPAPSFGFCGKGPGRGGPRWRQDSFSRCRGRGKTASTEGRNPPAPHRRTPKRPPGPAGGGSTPPTKDNGTAPPAPPPRFRGRCGTAPAIPRPSSAHLFQPTAGRFITGFAQNAQTGTIFSFSVSFLRKSKGPAF